MLVCSKCSLWNQYWVGDMLHDIGVVWWLSTSVCQVGFSNDVKNFVAISAGTSDTSGLTSIEIVTVFSYWIDILLDIYVHILHFTSSNAYLLLHEVFLNICS